MISARDTANALARATLAEHTALLLVVAEAQGVLSDPSFQRRIGKIRTLVGPLHLEDFHKLAEELWAELDTSQLSPYLQDRRRSSIEIVKNSYGENGDQELQERLDTLWANALVFPPEQAQWLSDGELWSWISSFQEDQKFSRLLLFRIEECGVEKVLEDLGGGISKEELLRKVAVLDFTMSELRLLQLVLELLVEYEVTTASTMPQVDFQLPKASEEESS